MAGMYAGLTAIADALKHAGVRASFDGTRVNPPGAWLSPQSIAHDRLDGGGTLTVHVYLIAPDTDPKSAYGVLDGLLAKAVSALEDLPEDTVLTSVALTDNGSALPAYRLTTTTEI